MKINRVTITGADNKTEVDMMVEITKQYPFVEWGILFSPKRIGEERYPDMLWLDFLADAFNKDPLPLSAHLCGGYTREMLSGNSTYHINHLEIFSRRQLNFNASRNRADLNAFFGLLERQDFNFILQQNFSNLIVCEEARKRNLKNVAFLYDSSGGRGTIANEWKKPFDGFFTGYAGGLSPDNLADELKKIEQVCGDAEIWIDTETRVRTNGVLDMNKVKQFLEIASKYIK